jgi:predicted Zn-dependent protease
MSEQQQVVCRPPRVCASYAHLGLSLASDTLVYTGHLGKARELT